MNAGNGCPRCGEDASLIDQDPDVPSMREICTTPDAWGPGPQLGVVAVHLLLLAVADRRGVVRDWRGALFPVLGATDHEDDKRLALGAGYRWTTAQVGRLVEALVSLGHARFSGGDLQLLVVEHAPGAVPVETQPALYGCKGVPT